MRKILLYCNFPVGLPKKMCKECKYNRFRMFLSVKSVENVIIWETNLKTLIQDDPIGLWVLTSQNRLLVKQTADMLKMS